MAGLLVWTNHSIVAVNAGWDTRPDALGIVAALDKALASWKSIVHSLALSLVKNRLVSTLSTGHWSVVFVLGQTISKTVSDKDGFQVDVALLVGKNLCGENWNVVTSVRFTCNVEILGGVFGELLEEEGEECVDILSSCDCVADLSTTVGVTDIDGLIEEDD